MEYDTKEMDVDLKHLDEAIDGRGGSFAYAFVWYKTPQGYDYWRDRKHTTDDLREIRRQYLEQLDTPFGELDEYTQVVGGVSVVAPIAMALWCLIPHESHIKRVAPTTNGIVQPLQPHSHLLRIVFHNT